LNSQKVVILTGVAGFIGFHLARFLLARGDRVIGIDNINDYYDVTLKEARLTQLHQSRAFTFYQRDLADSEAISSALKPHQDITHIVHLAAQAGVRHSLAAPARYVASNVQGHVTMLECARTMPALQNFVYASSSSVYGLNTNLPFRETDAVNRPSSVYAATKRADELISEAYAHLYGFPQTGLRFFTVYGPWGRPDMAYYQFAQAILSGMPVRLYDAEGLARDFTFIDDIIHGVVAAMDHPGKAGAARIFNLGGDQPTPVRDMVALLAECLGKPAHISLSPLPKTDVLSTWASLDYVGEVLGWRPKTSLKDGLKIFATWFKEYHGSDGAFRKTR